ncbi:MAG: hypothetical protein FWE85_05790 [Clostridiales bacterium]|nr:hypothetical protein [Clostridiales bacterium]
MFKQPDSSPWGEVQYCDTLCPGVYLVSTAGHGGILVAKEITAFLSPAARRCGFRQGNYLCFEEDSQEDVALRELLDKKLWAVPDRVRDKAAFEENINRNIQEYNPAYWQSREQGRAKQEAARPAPARDTRSAR